MHDYDFDSLSLVVIDQVKYVLLEGFGSIRLLYTSVQLSTKQVDGVYVSSFEINLPSGGRFTGTVRSASLGETHETSDLRR